MDWGSLLFLLRVRVIQVSRRGREVRGRMEVEMEEDEMGLNGKSAFAALPLRSPTSLSIYLDTEEGEREKRASRISRFPMVRLMHRAESQKESKKIVTYLVMD